MVNLNQAIRDLALSEGATDVGFADLTSLPAAVRKGFEHGIVIFMKVEAAIVAKIQDGPSKEYQDEYDRLNKKLNELDMKIFEFLSAEGYESFPNTQANVLVDKKTHTSVLPHKTIATLAGIGWIGKSGLLVTRKYGSAIRLSTVLTNARMEAGFPVARSQCGTCTGCVENCPAMALRGSLWDQTMGREELVDVVACDTMIKKRGKKTRIEHAGCGLCMWSCPYTKAYLKREMAALVMLPPMKKGPMLDHGVRN
jgi:epoxyqueuosine reductase QueG